MKENQSESRRAECTYLTPKQVHERWPFLSVTLLAQHRFKGSGPRFLKPGNGRVIAYRDQDVIEWIESSERMSTAATS